MSLGECMNKHTHRQYRTWMYWLDNLHVNQPGLVEHYLMSIVVEIRRLFSSKPNSIQISDALLKFKPAKALKTPAAKVSTGEMFKQVFMGMIRGQGKVYKDEQRSRTRTDGD